MKSYHVNIFPVQIDRRLGAKGTKFDYDLLHRYGNEIAKWYRKINAPHTSVDQSTETLFKPSSSSSYAL